MRLLKRTAATLALAALAVLSASSPALAGKPLIMQACTACHDEQQGLVRGKMVTYSDKFKTVQVSVGPLVWIIKLDEKTTLKNAKNLAEVEKDKEMSVVFTGSEKEPLATAITIKPPFTLPDGQLMDVDELKGLVMKGPEAGGYVLYDSRPPAAFIAGHIPYAVNLPFPKLKEKKEAVLPQNKDLTLIFYCQGFA